MRKKIFFLRALLVLISCLQDDEEALLSTDNNSLTGMQARAGLIVPSKEEVQHFLQKQLQIIASNVGADPTADYLDYKFLLK